MTTIAPAEERKKHSTEK